MDRSGRSKLAFLFFLGYMIITIVLFTAIIMASYYKIQISQWGTALMSSIWGAMSAKLNAIISFYFSSSENEIGKDHQINEMINRNEKLFLALKDKPVG